MLCAVCLQDFPILPLQPSTRKLCSTSICPDTRGRWQLSSTWVFAFYSSMVGQRQMHSFDGEGSMLPLPVLAVVQLDLALGFLNPQHLDLDAVGLGGEIALHQAQMQQQLSDVRDSLELGSSSSTHGLRHLFLFIRLCCDFGPAALPYSGAPCPL